MGTWNCKFLEEPLKAQSPASYHVHGNFLKPCVLAAPNPSCPQVTQTPVLRLSLFQVSTLVAFRRIRSESRAQGPSSAPGAAGEGGGSVPGSGSPCPGGRENKPLLSRPAVYIGDTGAPHRPPGPRGEATDSRRGDNVVIQALQPLAPRMRKCSRRAQPSGARRKPEGRKHKREAALWAALRATARAAVRSGSAPSGAETPAARERELLLPDLPKSIMRLVKHF